LLGRNRFFDGRNVGELTTGCGRRDVINGVVGERWCVVRFAWGLSHGLLVYTSPCSRHLMIACAIAVADGSSRPVKTLSLERSSVARRHRGR